METWVAYVRVLFAETLLAAHRNLEAEAEVCLALPAIESGQMLPEGLMVGALLRHSIEGQRIDPEAVSRLRKQLDRMNRGFNG